MTTSTTYIKYIPIQWCGAAPPYNGVYVMYFACFSITLIICLMMCITFYQLCQYLICFEFLLSYYQICLIIHFICVDIVFDVFGCSLKYSNSSINQNNIHSKTLHYTLSPIHPYTILMQNPLLLPQKHTNTIPTIPEQNTNKSMYYIILKYLIHITYKFS